MSTFLFTVVLATLIIFMAIMALGIGWLINGKSKLKSGSCGRDPTKKRNEDCNVKNSCDLCLHEEPRDHDKK